MVISKPKNSKFEVLRAGLNSSTFAAENVTPAMRYCLTIIFTFFAIICYTNCYSQNSSNTHFTITFIDSNTGEPLEYATCILQDKTTGKKYGAISSTEGACIIRNIPNGEYLLQVAYLGEEYSLGNFTINGSLTGNSEFKVDISTESINEVVVTAAESKGVATSSAIGKEAMKLIQPSSIADIMALLPGGKSLDPVLGKPQQIGIREAASISSSDYTTSALGTAFVIDGVPVNTDANMQSMRVSTSLNAESNYNFMNKGVDTRSISTDNIESVEVIRGIASAEYGDLTSGLIKVQRKHGGSNLEARFKADMQSKLFYVGKGLEWKKNGNNMLTMNIGADWLDSKSDPRNTRQNYSRAFAIYQIGYRVNGNKYTHSLNGSIDYTGSFDNMKSDADLDNGAGGPIETYKSDYNRMNIIASWRMSATEASLLRSVDVTASVTKESSISNSWRYLSLGTDTPLSTSVQEGEYDVSILPSEYDATLRVESKPFYAFFKGSAVLGFETAHSNNLLKIGAEWRMDKNYGDGYIFDVERPISPSMNLRPRAYDIIPAKHQAAGFAEASSNISAGKFDISLMAGVRSSAVFNIGNEYSLDGRIYLDPRFNVKVTFPSVIINDNPLKISLASGAGRHTKMPTMSQLFPDPFYYDIIQMNYWSANPDYRRINMRIFRVDPTNYTLKAARNFKWEVRGDLQWNGFALSVTYFKEDMKSGFRNGDKVMQLIAKDYDEQSIKHDALSGPPSLQSTPYTIDTTLAVYSIWNNGSRTQKSGVEFVFSTQRIRPIQTKLTVTGAYFKTQYSNSLPELYSPSTIIAGEAYPYVGCYKTGTQNYKRDMFNTNFMFDTQIPRLGLIFATSFECTWFTGGRTLKYSKYPDYYIDKDLKQHPFTQESAQNSILAEMIRTTSSILFKYSRIPFAMDINLKITKTLYSNKISASMFVNRIIDYSPSYKTNGAVIRRSTRPYFGMELNFKL